MEEILMLCDESEVVFEYGLTGYNYKFYAIGESGSDDISAMLENTLHRLIDAGLESETYGIMGAIKPDDVDWERLEEFGEYINIDLGYVTDGLITCWNEAKNND